MHTIMAFLGIEIGGTKLQSAVVGADGGVLAVAADTVQPGADGAEIRAAIARQLATLRGTAAGRGVEAAGVGFGGPVDRAQGVVATSFHVAGWSRFPLREWASRELGGLPVVVENDSNAAAFGEAAAGAGKGFRAAFYSNSGSGIGAGFVVGGAVYHGRPPGEMELGHVRIDRAGRHLEDVASGWAIDRAVREAATRHPDGGLARAAAGASPDARHLGAAIDAGDADARTILETAAGWYALGLSHAVHLLAPDVIVLGGGVAQMGGRWRDAVAGHLGRLLMEPMRPGPPVVLAALAGMAVPVGAALLAARHAAGVQSQ
jgi:glucokinase